MVGLQKGSPGGGGSLPTGKPGRETSRPASSRHGRTPQGRSDPAEEAHLTDEQWELVRPLLRPQRGEIGRPPNDHRTVLGGILWVARTGSSWREMPEEYGKWRAPTGAMSCGSSKAYGVASSECWGSKTCQDRQRRSLSDAVGMGQPVEKRRAGIVGCRRIG